MITRRRLKIAAALAAGCLVLLLAPLVIIQVEVHGDTAGSVAAVSGHHQVAIVPGAGLNGKGYPSLFLRERLDGAIALYRAGKVDGLLLSGDNHVGSYNEPAAMRAYALSHGVPAGAITLDYAGFDTYDTCFRARRIFGVQSAVVVSQSYHVPRAVYLCRSAGIDASGLGVPDWGQIPSSKMAYYQAREVLADVKAVWDADVTHPAPRYLGAHQRLHLQPFA